MLNKKVIEIYFNNCSTSCFEFNAEKDLENFTNTIKKYNKDFKFTLDPKSEALKKYKMVDEWRERRITTFEYLMWLNYASG